MHQFIVGKTYYGLADDEFQDMAPTKDERRHTLAQVAKGKGAKLTYEYDFGDSWIHSIKVEDALPAESASAQAVCLDGARACPPEDVGGSMGYENFPEALRDPKHPEHAEFLEWIGGPFDPEAFNKDALIVALKHLRPSRTRLAA